MTSQASATPIKLTDQSVDSKEYIARYLSFTKSDTVQYDSIIGKAAAAHIVD